MNKLKIVWKYITGGKVAVLEYGLELLNDAMTRAIDGGKDIPRYATIANNICETLDSCGWMIPDERLGAWERTISAAALVCAALEDGRITADEMGGIFDAFRGALSAWKGE